MISFLSWPHAPNFFPKTPFVFSWLNYFLSVGPAISSICHEIPSKNPLWLYKPILKCVCPQPMVQVHSFDISAAIRSHALGNPLALLWPSFLLLSSLFGPWPEVCINLFWLIENCMQSKHDFIFQMVLPGKCKTWKDKDHPLPYPLPPQEADMGYITV